MAEETQRRDGPSGAERSGDDPPSPGPAPWDPNLTADDVEYVDRLEERVRLRLARREQAESEVEAELSRARRESLAHLRQLVVRRVGQFGLLVGDLFGAVLGRASHAAGTAASTAASYRERFIRRLRGRVTLFRLDRVEDGFFERTAVVCDVVDMFQYVTGARVQMPVIIVGRFDRARIRLHGTDSASRGLRVTAVRRRDGDLFAVRDALGFRLPPMPPDTMLLLLAHDRSEDPIFTWAPILRRVASKAGNTETLLAWNGDLSRRNRNLRNVASD